MVEPHSSNFRVITTNFLGVRIFRKFTVTTSEIFLQVLARVCIATRPAITLTEAMSQEQLERLIMLSANLEFNHGNITWGGPWAGHALTCLLQDILEG